MPLQTPFKLCAMFALACASLLASSCADAFIYTVGRSGTANNCSFPTVQAALNAAAASNEDDEIWITRDVAGGYYQNQALTLENLRGKLKIVGGFDDCWDVTPEGVTELHGNGGPPVAVLSMRGFARVALSKLRITRGDADGNFGGGISYKGDGELLIEDSIVDNNVSAFSGGGVSVWADGGNVAFTLNRTEISNNRSNRGYGGGLHVTQYRGLSPMTHATFGDYVHINDNYAASGGGGVFIANNTTLTAKGYDFRMERNGTLGDGGAMLVETGAHTITIAPGRRAVGSLGTFVGNEASRGGAIALKQSVEHPLGGDTRLQLGSSEHTDPQLFFANRAHESGGALYIDRPRVHGALDGTTTVCAFNVGFDRNDAALGGSAVMASGSGARFMNENGNPGSGCPRIEVPCTHIACNHYTGHMASLDTGQPSIFGSLFAVAESAEIQLFGARISYNQLPVLFVAASTSTPFPRSSIGVDTALIYGNTGSSLASNQCVPEGTCQFGMRASTIVANLLSGHVFENAVDHFHLRESIIDQPGVALLAVEPSSKQSTLEHLLYTSTYASSIPSVRQGAPGFMNVAAMDYRLSGNSVAVDNLPAAGTVDFIGRNRSVDIPGGPNGLGPRDLGAVETQLWEVGVPDVILRNGFD